MRTVIWTVLSVAVATGGVAKAQPPKTKSKSIPVVYDGQLLVVTSAEGVAAFAFTDRVDKGTGYKFRFRPADGGKEQSGEGKVFERYKAVQGTNANDVTYVYDGGELFLTAGPVKLLWSRGDAKRGWLYFNPDKVTVQAVEEADFGTLELRRFAK